MKFKKENIASIKGTRPTKYDTLLDEFEKGGDTLFFDEEEISRQTASNIARRLITLSGKPFHSGYHVMKKKVYVRLRMENEVPEAEESEED